jgi:hypothetical protein
MLLQYRPMSLSRSVIFSALAAGLMACGADEAALAPTQDGFVDTTADATNDTGAQDTTNPDTGDAAADTSADTADTREVGETVVPLFGLKADERFIVPGNVAAKTSPAVAGPLVAWVEANDEGPTLVVWDTRVITNPPRVYDVALLTNPRELSLSDAFLVYVDDRYGDPDVFAIDLETGVEQAVVAKPGAQERPSVLGSAVAWEDCRDCVTGADVAGREAARQVWQRDLSSGDEVQVSRSASGAFSPRYGLLADGRQALAWVEGRAAVSWVRLLAGASGRFDLSAFVAEDQEIAGLELVAGLMVWRPRPLIVNPDSMIVNPDSMWPSDVLSTQAESGETTALTVHAELSGRLTSHIDGLGERVVWLESEPGLPRLGRLVRRELGAGVSDTLFQLSDMNGVALGSDYAVVTAPRADNDGLSDLHLFPLD